MLERIREGIQGPWAIAIVALIVVSFVFTGVGSYLSTNTNTAAAVVNDREISVQTVDIAFQNERARMEQQFGEAVSTLFANENYLADFRQGVLERLIDESLLAQKADELGLRVSDAQIKEAITQTPQFQIAGVFNNDTYLTTIQRAGYTPSEYAEFVRVEMTRNQLRQALLGSSIGLDSTVERFLALQQQTRDISVIEVTSDSYLDDVEISDADIEEYYQANITQFDTEEMVKLSYVSLSVENLMPRIVVTEQELDDYYQENISIFQTAEKREVAHILFDITDGQENALEQAQSARQRLTDGESFAQLAAELSADTLSAEEGGNLGVVAPGDFDDVFTDAVFALESQGDVSEPILTEFGYHIIKLTSLTPMQTQPFADVREQILEDVKQDKALGEFYALQAEMERIAFESSESLDDISQLTGRPVIDTNFFTANAFPASVNYPQIENVAFSPELVDDRVNSELLLVEEEKVMVVRVLDHQPQRTQTLEEVSASIRSTITAQRAQQLALNWANDVQIEIDDTGSADELLTAKSFTWNSLTNVSRNASDVNRELVSAAFGLSLQPGNDIAVITLSNGNVGIVRLDGVNAVAEISEENVEATKGRLTNQQAQRMLQNFVEALRSDADIQIMQ